MIIINYTLEGLLRKKDMFMTWIKENYLGILFCALIAIVASLLGKMFPIIGGPVFAIVIGMILALFIKRRDKLKKGLKFTSKKILQYAVILLGFGMNLEVVIKTGKQSLPIIICTILTSLILAYAVSKFLKIPTKIATLVGVGSSICGGSAIAATAPVIDADDEEVAQAISVIFLYNIIAALIFPAFGTFLGFSKTSGEAFGIFAGTAINDTSSVTAAASTWDTMYNLGSQTLDKAVTVKLTRTLAIIPITLCLAIYRAKKSEDEAGEKLPIKQVFPFFIIYFILASVITTILLSLGVSSQYFLPIKSLSKFFIVMAMAAIGFGTDIKKLITNGSKPILLGLICWIGITLVSLVMQHLLHIW